VGALVASGGCTSPSSSDRIGGEHFVFAAGVVTYLVGAIEV
jgi:hypothetical protein